MIETFGGDGYLLFFGILELMSDEFDIYNPGIVRLRIKKLTQNLQLSRQKTLKILRFCDQKAKINQSKDVAFFADIEKDHVIINCKKLAKLCDNHTQKLIKDTSKSLQSDFETTSSHRSKKKEVRSKTIKKNIKKKVEYITPYLGEFKNIKLTLEELGKLKIKFNNYKDRIENISHYIESKGDKYKSHYATILSWNRRDKEKENKKHTSELTQEITPNWIKNLPSDQKKELNGLIGGIGKRIN